MKIKRLSPIILMFAFVAAAFAQSPSFMPPDHRALTKTISYPEMETFLKSVDGKGPVHVTGAATTTKGRAVYLVQLSRTAHPSWNILFYAQQHGDEISGKDALLYLIRDIARHPDRLPEDTAVWILPMMNPDGAEAGTRVNGAGADLNRDHMTLHQPETRALYEVVRRVRPDIAVDCHEFGRASEAWRKRGWAKWPDVTMDALNNPLFDSVVAAAGQRWVEEGAVAEKAAGHPFLRYWVGGVPPLDEQRHSAPDIDSGMNGIGAYGGLSFIIEAAAGPDDAIAKELGNRVDAYLVLLRRFVRGDGHRAEDRAAIAKARSRAIPPFLPVNYLWVNPTGRITTFPVVETATGRVVEVPTPNLMTTLAVKKSVATPLGYVIDTRAAAEFASLLDRHGIPYERANGVRDVKVEPCTLLRVEDDFDEVYSRYEGRQIVRCDAASKRQLPAGSLLVPLKGETAVRAALLLEPSSMYGLYQYPIFRALAAPDGALPVMRVVK